MSRIAKKPIEIPAGVEIKLDDKTVVVQGPKGSMALDVHRNVAISRQENTIVLHPESSIKDIAMVGTVRSLLNNIVTGVTRGFERKLELVGVGYRAQVQGNKLNLTLGYSHPVDYEIPEGVMINTPNPTEVVVQGMDKQKVGQVAAEIRAFRPPEPYKGKGVRFANEQIMRKEAKKK